MTGDDHALRSGGGLHAADSDELDPAVRYAFDASIGPARFLLLHPRASFNCRPSFVSTMFSTGSHVSL